jgi:hypothetical protein
VIAIPIVTIIGNQFLLPNKAPRQKIIEIIKYIEQFSGKLTLDKLSDISKIQLENQKVDDVVIEYLYLNCQNDFQNTFYVGLNNSSITNISLAFIPKLFPNIFNLNLNNTNISNEGLQYLQYCKSLSVLSLSNINIDNNSIEILISIPNLRHLHIVDINLTRNNKIRLQNAGILLYEY